MPALRHENRAGIPPGSRFGALRFIPVLEHETAPFSLFSSTEQAPIRPILTGPCTKWCDP